LIPVWQRANDQGAWELGIQTDLNLIESLNSAMGVYVVGADPAGDDPELCDAIQRAGFVIVQDLFLTETAKLADVVFPAQAVMEREGTVVSGERRVQRYYEAVPPLKGTQPDYAITNALINKMGSTKLPDSATEIFDMIAQSEPVFKSLSYQTLAETHEQWPIVGRGDLYYGGTTYENTQGLGVQLAPDPENVVLGWVQPPEWNFPQDRLVAVPITRLYDRGTTLLPSTLLQERISEPYVALNPEEASRYNIPDGSTVAVTLNGSTVLVTARVQAELPPRVLLVPRSMGIPIVSPTPVEIKVVEKTMA
jgi:NADH-quinone oxidoreductase subunit G